MDLLSKLVANSPSTAITVCLSPEGGSRLRELEKGDLVLLPSSHPEEHHTIIRVEDPLSSDRLIASACVSFCPSYGAGPSPIEGITGHRVLSYSGLPLINGEAAARLENDPSTRDYASIFR